MDLDNAITKALAQAAAGGDDDDEDELDSSGDEDDDAPPSASKGATLYSLLLQSVVVHVTDRTCVCIPVSRVTVLS